MKRYWFIEETCTGKKTNPNFAGCIVRYVQGKNLKTVLQEHIKDVGNHSHGVPDHDNMKDWTEDYGYKTEGYARASLTKYLKNGILNNERFWDCEYKIISVEV